MEKRRSSSRNAVAKRMKRYEIFKDFHILSGPISAGESAQRNGAANAILNAMGNSCGEAGVYDFRHGFLDDEVVELTCVMAVSGKIFLIPFSLAGSGIKISFLTFVAKINNTYLDFKKYCILCLINLD